MLQGNLRSLVGSIKAVGRTGSCNHGHRTLTISTIERLQQVGLFTLGGKTCWRTATLNINDYQRELIDHCQVHGLWLQTDTRTRGRGYSQGTCKSSTYWTGTTADLILALNGDNTAALVLRQFMKDIGGRSNRIRAEIQFQSRFFSCGYQSVCRCLITSNIHITSWHLIFRLDTISGWNWSVNIMSIIISSLHHLDIILGNSRFLGKLFTQEVSHQIQVTIEEPTYKS